jgi:tetratricopeptide (TPR) repeat protein
MSINRSWLVQTLGLLLTLLSANVGLAQPNQPKTADDYFAAGAAFQRANDQEKALGMFTEAEKEYQTAIKLDGDNGDYYNLLGINYMEWGKAENAIEAYQQAVKFKPNHVYYYSLGGAYEKLGRLDEAVNAYKKSVEIKPLDRVLYQLGGIALKQGRHDEAVEFFRNVLALDATHVYANHGLGLVYAVMGNRTGAMQQYYILQNLNPALAADLLRSIPK